ncbi:hypothetical protein Tco_0936165 [Tanacetum coccineum]
MVVKNTKKTPQDSASKQSEHGTKRTPPKKPTPVKPTKPAPVKQTKPPLSQLPKSPKKKPSKITPSRKFCKGKPFNKNRNLKEKVMILLSNWPRRNTKTPDVEGKGKAIVIEEQAAHSLIDLSKKKSTTDQFILQRHDQAPQVDKEQGEVASTTVTSGVGISVRTENHAGSEPGQGHEALAGSNLDPEQEDSGPGKEHVALAGPNPDNLF